MTIDPSNLIRINLLPPERMPARQNLWVKAGVLLGMMGVTVIFILASLWINIVLIGRSYDISRMEKQIAEMQERLDEYADLKNQEDNLLQKQEVIDDLMIKRVAWAPKLNLLSDLLPDNIWLEKVSIRQERKQVDVKPPAAGKDDVKPAAGSKPDSASTTVKKKKITIYTDFLVLDAATNRYSEGTARSAEFMSNLEDSPPFMSGFIEITPRGGTLQYFLDSKIGGVSDDVKAYIEATQPKVWRFQVECKMKSREDAGSGKETKS
jgi:hypothetical protein